MIPKDNIKKYVGRLTNSDIEAVEETLQFWDNILF